MAEKIKDQSLGQEYYDRHEAGKYRIRPRFRKAAEFTIRPLIEMRYGRHVMRGGEDVQRDKTYIVVGNHRHFLDIFYNDMATLDLGINTARPVMKRHYVDAPYSPVFHALGGIGVGRGTADKIPLQNRLMQFIADGYSPWLYIEGTRIRSQDVGGNPVDTKKLAGVKDGALELSLRSGVELLPLLLAGTADDDVRKSQYPIVTCVGEPISPQQFEIYDNPVAELRAATAEQMQTRLDDAYAVRNYMIDRVTS